MKSLAFSLCALLVGAAQWGPKPTEPLKEGVFILRVLNTVEAQLNSSGGSFAPLSAVPETPMAKSNLSEASLPEPLKASIGKRSLVLVLADDRKHYQAMVLPAEECGVGVFTNEGGLIYSGRALGCEK